MKRVKVLVMGLVLALVGFVYAAGQAHEMKNTCCGRDKASAGCCASCCRSEGSCCKTHKMSSKHAKAQPSAQPQHDCSASGKCCTGENSCCQSDKSGKAQTRAEACEMKKDGASCCASGAGCCGKGCSSKSEPKPV
jgi:hypothetical protein